MLIPRDIGPGVNTLALSKEFLFCIHGYWRHRQYLWAVALIFLFCIIRVSGSDANTLWALICIFHFIFRGAANISYYLTYTFVSHIRRVISATNILCDFKDSFFVIFVVDTFDLLYVLVVLYWYCQQYS